MAHINQEALRIIIEAPSSLKSAIRALEICAEYFEAGKPLPPGLDEYMAAAIRNFLKQDSGDRGKKLAETLNIRAQHKRRTEASAYDVGRAMEKIITEEHCTTYAAAMKTIKSYSYIDSTTGSKRKISRSTAERLYDRYLEGVKITNKLNLEN